MRGKPVLGLVLLGLFLASCASDAEKTNPKAAAMDPVTLTCTAEDQSSPFSAAKVTLTPQGQDVRAKWEWTGDLPPTGMFGLFVTLDGPREGDLHQLGFETQDGRQIAFFDFDMTAAKQRNLTGSVNVNPTSAEMAFLESSSPFADGFKATGAVSVDGVDVMSCT